VDRTERFYQIDRLLREQRLVSFEQMLRNKRAAYLHVHFAKFGCYAARVDRA